MEAVFLKMLNLSLTAGWLILAVLILRMLLKKAPMGFRCLLWILVGIRLISPVSIKSVLSLIPSAKTVNPESIYSGTPGINSGISYFNRAVNPVISRTIDTQAATGSNQLQMVLTVLSIIWLAGIALLLIYLLFSYFSLRHRVAAAIHQRDNLWICDDIASPFILGIFRPRIYLPSGIDEQQISYVIAHEQAHLKRHDHWWKPFGFLLVAIYWLNPLIWLAYWLLCRDIELACDEKAIRDMSLADRKAYSGALLSYSLPRRLIAACPLAFGEVGVKERIRKVMNYKKPSFWILLTALIACIIVAVCFLTNPRTEPVNSQLNFGKTVELSFSDQVFVSSRCLYMNPLSSMAPFDDNGLVYYISNDSFRIIDKNGNEKLSITGQDNWYWQEMTAADWDSLFKINIGKPEAEDYTYPRLMQISSEYFLFDMDGQLWVGEYRDDKIGIWSIYSLQLKVNEQLTLAQLLQAGEKGDLTWEYLNSFTHTDIGSGLFVYEFIIDDFWRLLISSADSLDSVSETDFPAIFNLEYRSDGEMVNLHQDDMAAFIARKESARTGIPFVHSGYSLCAMSSAAASEGLPKIDLNPVHWDKYNVPFSVYIGGKEISGGLYTLSDIKTGEKLEFFTPSGLAAQTYILHDTIPGHEYKISLSYHEPGDEEKVVYQFIIAR